MSVTTWQQAVVAGGRDSGLDALTGVVVDALRYELPVLAGDPDLLEAARSSTAANIALAVELVGGAITLADVEAPPQAAAFARELARRNVPVAELDRAYRVASLALWRWAVAEVRTRVEGDMAAAIAGLSEAVFATGDIFSATVMERYTLERERWLRSADAMRATTVREVLDGGPLDVTATSSRLRYELRQSHQAFVVWSSGEVSESMATVGGPRSLLWPMGTGAIAGWAPAGSLDPARLDPSVSLALGSPGPGVEGFRRSHTEALEARRVARLLRRDGATVHYDDVVLLALLTQDIEQARRFARRTLGPLAQPDPGMRRLADTLRATLEHQGSPRRAAQVLDVHENTVAKRMRSVDQLLGDGAQRHPAQLLAALEILDVLLD